MDKEEAKAGCQNNECNVQIKTIYIKQYRNISKMVMRS